MIIIRKTLIVAAIAALLPLAATAGNEEGKTDRSPTASMRTNEEFRKLDTNGDGRISQSESTADATIMWKDADANGDGYIDTGEWLTVPGDSHDSRERIPRQE